MGTQNSGVGWGTCASYPPLKGGITSFPGSFSYSCSVGTGRREPRERGWGQHIFLGRSRTRKRSNERPGMRVKMESETRERWPTSVRQGLRALHENLTPKLPALKNRFWGEKKNRLFRSQVLNELSVNTPNPYPSAKLFNITITVSFGLHWDSGETKFTVSRRQEPL